MHLMQQTVRDALAPELDEDEDPTTEHLSGVVTHSFTSSCVSSG